MLSGLSGLKECSGGPVRRDIALSDVVDDIPGMSVFC
jgi:hypothetical protein